MIAIGLVRKPDSRTHSRPVSSPLPLRRWQPAKTGSMNASPSCGHDDRDAGPHRSLADDARALAADERRVPHAHAGHVRDRVERARPEPAQDDSVVACAHAVLPFVDRFGEILRAVPALIASRGRG